MKVFDTKMTVYMNGEKFEETKRIRLNAVEISRLLDSAIKILETTEDYDGEPETRYTTIVVRNGRFAERRYQIRSRKLCSAFAML